MCNICEEICEGCKIVYDECEVGEDCKKCEVCTVVHEVCEVVWEVCTVWGKWSMTCVK